MNDQNRIHLVRRVRPEECKEIEGYSDSAPSEVEEQSEQLEDEDLSFWRYAEEE